MFSYNALLLLATLHNYNSKVYGHTPDMIPKSAQRRCASRHQKSLREFLDCLAHVCHSRKDGRAVTAIAIREQGRHACYVVASPGRLDWVAQFPKDSDLKRKELRNFLSALLSMFSRSEQDVGRPGKVKTRALSHIVDFNLRRLISYVLSLDKDIQLLAHLERSPSNKQAKPNGKHESLNLQMSLSIGSYIG